MTMLSRIGTPEEIAAWDREQERLKKEAALAAMAPASNIVFGVDFANKPRKTRDLGRL